MCVLWKEYYYGQPRAEHPCGLAIFCGLATFLKSFNFVSNFNCIYGTQQNKRTY